ncbi:MAG: DUF4388 domain-containing protein [Candidatus Krumholzibacteriota bacterium]|nr:DUF4388 domain-containing protein [Candidatus Krumholzibacteriota bacterium]
MKRFNIIGCSLILLLCLFYAPVHSQSNARIQAENLFVEAQKALTEGDDRLAESLLMRSLQQDPSFTSAIWQLSQIYEKRDQLEYARELILRGLQQDPNASWAREKLDQMERILVRKLLREAEEYMSTGNYDLALPKLSLYLGIKPFDPVPLIRIGRCHLALGNLKTAKDYMVQAIERDPTNSEVAALLDEIEERMEQSSQDAAVRRARSILANYTPQDKAEAEKALQEVLNNDPHDSWALEKLAELRLLEEKEDPSRDKAEPLEKSIDALKTLKDPAVRIREFLRDRIFTLLLLSAIVLLALNLKRRARIKNYPLQGSLTLIPVLDIVSLLNSNLKSGRLLIHSKDARGEIYFEKGEIVHARFKSYDGKTAFHKMMEFRSGTFTFFNHLPNTRHTISEPLSLLLLSMKSDAEAAPPKNKQPSNQEMFTAVKN